MSHKHDNDTLLCLFLHGPTFDGDVPSKTQRDELFDAGLISRGNGFQWLTNAGVVFAFACGYEVKKRQHQRRMLAQHTTAAEG
jgi:hypothetical protein